jgi:hypothetical protein
MTIQVRKISDGYVVSEYDTWIPGVYESEEAAKLAATLSPEAVHIMWEAVLESGRDTATLADVNGAS